MNDEKLLVVNNIIESVSKCKDFFEEDEFNEMLVMLYNIKGKFNKDILSVYEFKECVTLDEYLKKYMPTDVSENSIKDASYQYIYDLSNDWFRDSDYEYSSNDIQEAFEAGAKFILNNIK